VTLDELERWLDHYGDAWGRRDVGAFLALFHQEASYHWGPFSEPLRGHAEIGRRLEQALSGQADVRFGHEPLAMTPDGRGICRWWVSFRVPADRVVEDNEGIFLVTLGPDGRCVEFREWWNQRTSPGPERDS
jgi:hypothetical protein